MPTYEYDCPECGHQEDIFKVEDVMVYDGGLRTVECLDCGTESEVRFGAPAIVGVISNPKVFGDTGVVLNSREEQKAWEQGEGANITVHEPGTPSYKRWEEKAQGRLDHQADRMGYRNWSEKQKDGNRKRNLEAGVDTPNPMR